MFAENSRRPEESVIERCFSCYNTDVTSRKCLLVDASEGSVNEAIYASVSALYMLLCQLRMLLCQLRECSLGPGR